MVVIDTTDTISVQTAGRVVYLYLVRMLVHREDRVAGQCIHFVWRNGYLCNGIIGKHSLPCGCFDSAECPQKDAKTNNKFVSHFHIIFVQKVKCSSIPPSRALGG